MKTFRQKLHSIVRRVAGIVFHMLLVVTAIRVQATTYYVDGARGDNAYNGLTNVVLGGLQGPKRNVSNAISTASTSDSIIAAPGIYQELEWNLQGKNLLLYPQGQVTIVDFDPGQTDTDGDGIPDWWTLWYFGHPTGQEYDHSRATDDADGDGYVNIDEFRGDSDPTDPSLIPFRNLFFYDNLGRLAVATGTSGTDTAFYDYDAVGNLTAIRRETVGPVNLFVFSPETGGGNATITLQGTGFSTNLANNAVHFGDTTAQVISATANQLKVLVPTNAHSGLISVQTPLGVSTNSKAFNVGIGVSVSPSAVTFLVPSTQQFTAVVYGATDQSVTWNLNGSIPAGSNTIWGTISTDGFYTSPTNQPFSNLITVHARRVADPDPLKDGIATITVQAPLGPIYSPTVSAQPGVPTALGPIYSPTASAQPGIPNMLGPIYSSTVSVCANPCPPCPP